MNERALVQIPEKTLRVTPVRSNRAFRIHINRVLPGRIQCRPPSTCQVCGVEVRASQRVVANGSPPGGSFRDESAVHTLAMNGFELFFCSRHAGGKRMEPAGACLDGGVDINL